MTYPPYPPQQQQAYYPPQPQAQYSPQPYGPQYAPPQQYAAPAPPPPVVHGTLDGFFDQPAGGNGKSISFDRKAPGTTYTGVVVRTLTNADIQAQTDIRDRSRILTHPDGRPKLVMIVPLQMQPSQEFPDGRAAWYVKGADRTELERAMEVAGCKPGTAPEAGAIITITYVGDRPIPNLNAQKVKQVTYQRPAGANGNGNGHAANPELPASVQVPQPAAAPVQPAFQPQQYGQPYSPGAQYAPDPSGQAAYDMVTGNGNAPQYQQFQAPQYAPPAPPPAPVPYAPLPAPDPRQYMQQPAPAAAPAQPATVAQPQLAPPPDLSPDQQALLAKLTGQ